MSQDSDYWKNKWTNRGPEPASNFARRVFKIINNANFHSVLDVGCGHGRDSIYFFKKGLEVTATDISESGIKKLKKREGKINYLLSDLRDLDFPKNSFDVIYAHLSLHYFDDESTDRIFNNLYKILKKGGLIFVKCKSTDDVVFGKGEKVGENMYKYEHVRHFFTKEYMTEKLQKFDILRLRKTSSVYRSYKSSFIEAEATKK